MSFIMLYPAGIEMEFNTFDYFDRMLQFVNSQLSKYKTI